MVWPLSSKGPSGFSSSSTAEEVTEGIDVTGLTAVVTGATAGIGRETARVLALRGVRVVIGVRDPSSGRSVRDELLKEMPPAKIDVLELDLSSMASVRAFASEFDSLHLPLNVLINNAATVPNEFKLSADGIEMQFATNYLGHFLLTHLLLENMKNTARSSSIEGRIVNLTSSAHAWSYREGILFDEINNRTKHKRFTAYGQTKLAAILHANELTKRLKEEEVRITANSVHPGPVVTDIFRHHPFINAMFSFVGKLVAKSIQQGAATTCYVALHPQVQEMSGKYFADCNVAKPSYQAADEVLAKKLWDFSMALIGVRTTPSES